MSKSKDPKYIKRTGDTIRYQRAVPTSLQHIARKRLWTRPLSLKSNATDTDIAAAWAEANKAFDLYCRTLENSSPAAYTENELERLAEDLLRRKGLKVGQFADVLNPEVTAQEEQQNTQLQSHPYNYADGAIPEFDDIVDDLQREDRQPTVQEEAVLRAWKAVQTKQKQKPKTLSSLWSAYLKQRGVNPETRDGARIQRRWDNMMAFVKDTVVTPNTPDHIEVGIDEYVENELERGLAPTSVYRSLREPLACFKWANRHYRLKWRTIEIQPQQSYSAKKKRPLTHEDQRLLLDTCLKMNDWVSAALLFMLQGGCMPSEIARLRPEQDLQLLGRQPYVIISGGDEGLTKQEARKRLVPVVLAADLLRERLPEAIAKLSAVKEPSATISKRLKTKVGEQYSSHCLRHTFRANGSSASVNPMHLHAIGGWTGENINKVMLDYGAEGIEHSEMLQTLTEASKKIHGHLLTYLKNGENNNVIPLRG